jgi:hypothetical protein
VNPPNDFEVDAMVSVIAHELTEVVTNYLFNAWKDADGDENADKCIWNFGTTHTTSTGATVNSVVGGRDFLLQMNWDPDWQMCAIGNNLNRQIPFNFTNIFPGHK